MKCPCTNCKKEWRCIFGCKEGDKYWSELEDEYERNKQNK